MAELPRCRLATWADVDMWSEAVAAKVRASDRIPETIVGLTRGGWVPSRLLADRLGVKRVLSLRAQHWGVTATPTGHAELTEGLSGPVDGQRVLIVDDIADTGESLELALRCVRDGRPARAETAAFLHLAHSKLTPTYWGEEIPRDEWVWVVFPWNYWEDLTALGVRARELDSTLPGIQRVLAERCGWTVPAADLERVARVLGWA